LKRLNYSLLALIFLVLLLFIGGAEAEEVITTALPTRSQLRPPFSVFPGDLHCEYMEGVSKGPTWGNITIGVSKVEDLKRYVTAIYDYDVYEYADFIQFAKRGKLFEKDGIPSGINACIDINTRTVTALLVTLNRQMFIRDLIAVYGIPDAITWGSSSNDRTAIWFDKGIGVSIYILKDYKILGYGEIGLIDYFPYQSKIGFENRWPYNQTSSENPPEGDHRYEPTPSRERNPFDFDAMVATITAEPSRTPTPTFVPYTPVATATP
jgi:hypothetical protein